MRTDTIKACVCVMTMLTLASWVQAAPIDLHRAVSGADRPFTTLKDNLPTEWQLWLEPRITGPTTTNWDYHFPERSFGNTFNATQSHLLGIGTRRRMVEGELTGIWLIWDMLAWVPVPHLLYLEKSEPMGAFMDPWFYYQRPPHVIGAAFIPNTSLPAPEVNAELVPEPTSGALILMGSLLLMSRTTRRRYARV